MTSQKFSWIDLKPCISSHYFALWSLLASYAPVFFQNLHNSCDFWISFMQDRTLMPWEPNKIHVYLDVDWINFSSSNIHGHSTKSMFLFDETVKYFWCNRQVLTRPLFDWPAWFYSFDFYQCFRFSLYVPVMKQHIWINRNLKLYPAWAISHYCGMNGIEKYMLLIYSVYEWIEVEVYWIRDPFVISDYVESWSRICIRYSGKSNKWVIDFCSDKTNVYCLIMS